MSEWNPISSFDRDCEVEVLLWAEEYDHPSTAKLYEGEWYFTANGADTLYYRGTFGNEYAVEFIEPTHWMHLPEKPKEQNP